MFISVGWLPVVSVIGLVLGLALTHARLLSVASLAVAYIGAGLLFWAKLPLYRAGIFSSFGPWAIPSSHRRYYYWGMGLAAGGCVLTAMLIPLIASIP